MGKPELIYSHKVDGHPLAVGFTIDHMLVHLEAGGKEVARRLGMPEDKISIHVSKIDYQNTGNGICAAAPTGIDFFAGDNMGTPFNHNGDLTIGNDGLAYVCGGRAIFELPENDGVPDSLGTMQQIFSTGLYQQAARSFIGMNNLDFTLFSVQEHNDVLYCSFSDTQWGMLGMAKLIAYNRDRMVGNPLQYDIPRKVYEGTWISMPGFDPNPRVVVHDDSLYIRARRSIFKIGLKPNKNSLDKGVELKLENLHKACIPSQHCFDVWGVLYAITQEADEAYPSIKGYLPGDNGEYKVCTYLPLLWIEKHLTTFTKLATSGNGLLAVADYFEKNIDIYRLPYVAI